MRLDRLIQSSMQIGRRPTRALLASREVRVNGSVETSANQQISAFDRVDANGTLLQARVPRYVILNKPVGVVSATTDPDHQTVIDLIDERWANELHLAGRLDRFTSGLIVLTNDSSFSEALTRPEKKVPKTYLVDTDSDILPAVITAFQQGIHFAKEGITTQPATVELRGKRQCQLTIFEGKHHQIKRMFAQFDIKVTGLRRESVGHLQLNGLAPGHFRQLTPQERLVP